MNPFAIIARCRRDPEFFCREVLGVHLWSAQVAILRAIIEHRRVCVPSGHNVGKTFVAACAALWFLACNPGSKVVTTSTSFDVTRLRLWREIRKLHQRAKIPLGGEMLEVQLKMDGVGWEAVGLNVAKPDSFHGLHAENILILFDEAQGIPREIWEASESMMGSSNARWLAIANPVYTTGEFFEACRNPKDWHRIRISCEDHPNVLAARAGGPPPFPAAVSAEWVDRCRKRWGADSGLFRSRVLGEFPKGGENTVIPHDLLEEASKTEGPVWPGDGRHLGVDIARFGTDSNVAVLVVDGVVANMERWDGQDLMTTTGRIQHLAREWSVPAENVHVDVIGVGGGVVDRLRELNFMVDAVNFGEAPLGDHSATIGPELPLKNRRAELYWACRCLLAQKRLRIPVDFADVWAELTWPTYKFDSGARLQLEAKDEIKERMGGSPDHGDALVLALSRTGRGFGLQWVA